MRAKITQVTFTRKQRFNLGDFHSVELSAFCNVHFLNDKAAQVTFDGTDDDMVGIDVDLEDGDGLIEVAVKVQELMKQAIKASAQEFTPYIVPFTKKGNVPVTVKKTFQGSEEEE